MFVLAVERGARPRVLEAKRSYVWGRADRIRTGMEGRGIPVYFFGRTYRDRGPVYYFPAVLAAKLPLGLLALAGLVLFAIRKLLRWCRLPGFGLVLLAGLFLEALARRVLRGLLAKELLLAA